VGNKRNGPPTQIQEKSSQEGHAGHPVNVIITVDEDRFPGLQRGENPPDGGKEVWQVFRRVEVGKARPQKALGGVGIRELPDCQEGAEGSREL
jgi:hypothetical protein